MTGWIEIALFYIIIQDEANHFASGEGKKKKHGAKITQYTGIHLRSVDTL